MHSLTIINSYHAIHNYMLKAISTKPLHMLRIHNGNIPFMCRWIPFGDHPLTLERCREC